MGPTSSTCVCWDGSIHTVSLCL